MSKVSKKRAAAEGGKDTAAIALITLGVSIIQKGDYLVGGGLVAAGWILLVVDKVI